MSEQTRKRIVYAIGVAGLLFGIYNLDLGGGAEPPSEAAHETIKPLNTAGAPTAMRQTAGANLASYADSSWGRDPFRIRSPQPIRPASRPQEPTWSLSGILFHPTNPLAYVNGKAVQVDDMINGARVTAIDRETVTLEYKGKPRTIRVKKSG